ncbi:hypothetical protein [Ferruginibacter sp.]|nr:hypothetical protein [Ferruginibacter sp.]
MKISRFATTCLLLLTVFILSSCEAIASIFKAGMGFGIFIVIAVVGIIAFIIIKISKNKNS